MSDTGRLPIDTTARLFEEPQGEPAQGASDAARVPGHSVLNARGLGPR